MTAYTVWTDGSKLGKPTDPGPMGWAAVGSRGVIASGGDAVGTNINGEVLAIEHGLKALLRYKVPIESVEIRADCAFALDTVRKMHAMGVTAASSWVAQDPAKAASFNWPHMLEAAKAACALNEKGATVTFTKVKAHDGSDVGNAFADHVAKECAKKAGGL